MHKVLIWGAGKGYCRLINLIKCYEREGMFQIIGVTSNESYYSIIDDYPFIPQKDLKNMEYDYIIATMENQKDAIKESNVFSENAVRDKIIPGRVLQHPDFDFNIYLNLKKKVPSIISKNCFGGVAYHELALPFCSPTINMWWADEDYYKLLSDLKGYMELPLEFFQWGWEINLKREYPICRIGDIYVNMNHYNTFEEAEEKWNERKKRINYDNLFIANYTEDRYWANAFCNLPYQNKMCLTNFEMEGCLNVKEIYESFYQSRNIDIGGVLNDSALGQYRLYDLFQKLNS